MDRIIKFLLRDKEVFLLPIIVIAMMVSFLPLLKGSKDIVENKETIFLAAGTFFAFMGVVMTRFLSGTSTSRDLERERIEFKYLHHELRALSKQKSLLSEDNKEELINSVKNQIEVAATEDYLNKLKQQISESEYRLDIAHRGKTTLDRIYAEIDALGRRGTINLVLGVITAFSGVIALSFFVLINEPAHQSVGDFAMAFLPRLSIVIIIEIFSYFFLRLYKSSLSEIKYFQNEATNIEHNFVALEASIKIEDKNLIDKCIHKFLTVERNPILANGQTTRELAAEKLESDKMSVSPDYLVKIIEAIKKE